MCYADFHEIMEAIAAMDADVVSLEASRSEMELLGAFRDFKYPNDIGPGVYDIHSPPGAAGRRDGPPHREGFGDARSGPALGEPRLRLEDPVVRRSAAGAGSYGGGRQGGPLEAGGRGAATIVGLFIFGVRLK